MAELDDFFAKKDKKKSKGKKFMTTEEIAKKLEEKWTEKPKKDKSTFQSGQNGEKGNTKSDVSSEEVEEEWKDFEEEKKDYSGLKIQNLNLYDDSKSDSGDCGADAGELEINERGQHVWKKKGAWKELAEGEANTTQPEVADATPAPTTPAPAAPRSNVYVAPFMRNQQQQQQPTNSNRLRGNASAPDIMNQDFFPTLSAASKETAVSWNRKKQDAAFEEARNSKSHSNRDSRVAQRLEIGNKFGALQNENS